jgi:hypothetical protein
MKGNSKRKGTPLTGTVRLVNIIKCAELISVKPGTFIYQQTADCKKTIEIYHQ